MGAAGFYPTGITTRLPSGVHYTTDGSTPSTDSPQASGLTTVPTSAVLRYASFDAGGQAKGPAHGASYLIDEPPSRLLTLSIGIDPWRLFHPVKGWFQAGHGADPNHWKQPGANWWTSREHPAHLDLLEADGSSVFSGTIGFRMFGGMSRLHPQKSFSISARAKYGQKRIKHRLFGKDAGKNFRFLVARNAGSDWNRSFIRDALLSGLLRDESWDLDHQAARPVRVYLNGRYWGIYHLREKINPQFLKDRYPDIEKGKVDLLEHQETVKHGRLGAYKELRQYLATTDLSQPANYRRLGKLMDTDNFMRLQIAQTYFDNRDAGGNIRFWRPQRPGARWRWILYDVDQGFGLHHADAYARNTLEFYTATDGPSWPNPPWSTLFQRRLLTNPTYRRQFVNRSLDYLHTDFRPVVVLAAIEKQVTTLRPEMPRQLARWRGKMANWEVHIERLREFARQRPAHLREHYRNFFSAGADRAVTVTADPGGYVRLNDNIRVDETSLHGHYFERYPISVAATPHPGFRFVGWANRDDTNSELAVDLSRPHDYHLRALFEPYDHPLANQVVINEYCPRNKSSGDWIELHNRSAEPVSLEGWRLVDSRNECTLPAVTIAPGDYLVVCRRPEDFRRHYPTAHNVVPGLQFGLDKDGEKIGLYGPRGGYVNAVHLSTTSNDSAFVQALVLPGLDNTKPENWTLAPGAGTPCAANPDHLQAAVVTSQDYWLRIGIGLGVLVLMVIIKQQR